MDGDCDILEIVHAGSFEVFIGDEKTKGAYEVEFGAGGGAEAGDVAGVLGDLGVYERDFQNVFWEHFARDVQVMTNDEATNDESNSNVQ